MNTIISFIDKLNWGIIILLCVTMGLAPFSPPHILEKLSMLIKGNLIKPIDWFDLFLHATPWIILILKAMAKFKEKEPNQ